MTFHVCGVVLPFGTCNANVAELGVLCYAIQHLYGLQGGPERPWNKLHMQYYFRDSSCQIVVEMFDPALAWTLS